jgi:hypothetical protein
MSEPGASRCGPASVFGRVVRDWEHGADQDADRGQPRLQHGPLLADPVRADPRAQRGLQHELGPVLHRRRRGDRHGPHAARRVPARPERGLPHRLPQGRRQGPVPHRSRVQLRPRLVPGALHPLAEAASGQRRIRGRDPPVRENARHHSRGDQPVRSHRPGCHHLWTLLRLMIFVFPFQG